MISVCMATKDGVLYLREQMDSILMQLGGDDEVIVSDDSSTDSTISILKSYQDQRIKILKNSTPKGVTKNFETALSSAKGDFIFLADQDDVWAPSKVQTMLLHLKDVDLVVSDCKITNEELLVINESFFSIHGSKDGLIQNFIRNSYMGCCMAFKRSVLEKALPIPARIPMHDFWIGLIAELHFTVRFIPEALVFHRRHSNNLSSNGSKSTQPLRTIIANRYYLLKHLFLTRLYVG
jgi:GT2 family glycosyltransferase